MSKIKYAAAALPMLAAALGVSFAVATPASAHSARPAPAPVTASVAAEYDLAAASPLSWYIFNFYPSEQVCEDQRWWGTTQGWWTWDDSACATNGTDWALFIYFDGLTSGSASAAADR